MSGSLSSNDKNLLVICLVSHINKVLSVNEEGDNKGESLFDAEEFLVGLKNLMLNYCAKFQHRNLSLGFGEAELVAILDEFELSQYVSLREKNVAIRTIPNKFEEKVGEVVVSAVSEYAKYLVNEINALGVAIEDKRLKEKQKEIETARPADDINMDASSVSASALKADQNDHENQESEQGLRKLKEETVSDDVEEVTRSSENSEVESTAKALSEQKKASRRTPSSGTSSTAQHKKFQNIAANLIDNILAHRFSSPFLQPVNPKEAPGYDQIIYEPKDLKSILKSLKLKKEPPDYLLLKEVKRDIMLMLANCVMYNQSNSDLVQLTRIMKEDVNSLLKLFEEAENDKNLTK